MLGAASNQSKTEAAAAEIGRAADYQGCNFDLDLMMILRLYDTYYFTDPGHHLSAFYVEYYLSFRYYY